MGSAPIETDALGLPPQFLCPFTGARLEEPMMSIDCGHHFERRVLELAIQQGGAIFCPVDGMQIDPAHLVNAREFRALIQHWDSHMAMLQASLAAASQRAVAAGAVPLVPGLVPAAIAACWPGGLGPAGLGPAGLGPAGLGQVLGPTVAVKPAAQAAPQVQARPPQGIGGPGMGGMGGGGGGPGAKRQPVARSSLEGIHIEAPVPKPEARPHPKPKARAPAGGPTDSPTGSEGDPERAPVDPRKYKTRLCRNWIQNRACSYEHTCCFAHGESELRDTIANMKILQSLGYFVNGQDDAGAAGAGGRPGRPFGRRS
eukprot:EG_transcript_20760